MAPAPFRRSLRRVLAAAALTALAVAGLGPVGPAAAANTAEIHGIVYGEGTPNVPLPDAQVALYSGSGLAGVDTTDAGGHYDFTGLAAGNYRIFFIPPFGENYLQEYWDNQSPQTATVVPLTAGQVLNGIDPVLARGATVSGHVTLLGSSSAVNVQISVVRADGVEGVFGYTDNLGNYTLSGIAPGTSTLRFRDGSSVYASEYYSDSESLATATFFTIDPGAAIVGKDAELSLGGSIAGSVLGAGSPTVPLASARVYAYKAGVLIDDTEASSDGSYWLSGLPLGDYTLRFDAGSAGSYASEYWDNQSSAANAATVSLSAPAALTGYTAVLDPGGSIGGRISTADFDSLDAAAVLFTAGGSDGNSSTFVAVAQSSVANNGLYEFAGVPFGSYKVGFTTDLAGLDGLGNLSRSGDYAAEWFGDVYTYAQATTVSIDAATPDVYAIDGTLLYPAFADVADPSNPVYEYIQWMFDANISTGTAQGAGLKPLYKPALPVSRQAMASFLFKLSGDSFTAPVEPTFADVATDATFYTAIEWMAAEGISVGTAQPAGKPLFKPTDPVSRQAMALFLARYAGVDISVTPTEQSFADVPVSSSPAAAIAWMKDAGISVGTTQPSGLPLYKPSDPVSRQAMAAFLFRLDHLSP